jgi:arabinan endo-1,5-alpha-L-arabinosidase
VRDILDPGTDIIQIPHARLLLPALLVLSLLGACAQGAPAPAGGASQSADDAPRATSAPPTSTSPTPTGKAYPDPLPVKGDVNLVHDPSMVRRPDGTYLLYSTGQGLPIRTSRDRTTFAAAGSVWPEGAPWAEKFTSPSDPSALWAPDISYHHGRFYLYYSASSFGSRHSAIFLATSRTGESGSWKHVGRVWETSETDDYNAIDPNLVVDGKDWWLSFGSFWSGVKMVRLDPRTGLPVSKDTTVHSLATRPIEVDGAIEAPYVVRQGDYFYLFAAFDACCRGLDSTYRTMVGRARSVTGPYLDRTGRKMTDGGGTEVMASHGSITGPGHPAVLHDGADWLLIYHHYYDENNPGAARLGINRLAWVDGWPVAR